jgi:hypothetical protein
MHTPLPLAPMANVASATSSLPGDSGA